MIQNLKRRALLRLRRLFGKSADHFTPHGILVWAPVEADLKIHYDLTRGRPYENSESDMIRAHLPAGMSVIELGGCLGIISALIRQKIGPTPRHIVVEASDRLAKYCHANANLGAAIGATDVVVAAVDYSGAESVSFAIGRMAHSGRVAANGGMSVPTTTLSKLAATLPDGPFALVCDVEGAELPMIAHEAALLSRVAVMILETHPKLYPAGKADLAALLAQVEATGLRQVARAANVYAFSRV